MTEGYVLDWLNLAVRWVHVITGIAWIGASFYFNWLLNRLLPSAENDPNVTGELWALHAGGFFRVQKRNMPPGPLPEPMHWFKWEAYWTWISGMTLLMLVYYVGAEQYLIDPQVMDLSHGAAVTIGLAVIIGGTGAYDAAWRSRLADNPGRLTLICCVGLAVIVFALCQLFGGRGAYMHAGALLGTIMVANVAHVIMPSQRRMVAATVAGEPMDPALARAAGLRSLHNNYLTLPVVFVMFSAHYPATYGHELNWLVLLAVFAVGALVRHYFNVRVRQGNWTPAWQLVGGAAGLALIAVLAAPRLADPADLPTTAEVERILAARCASCHAAQPTQPGFAVAPKGLVLESLDQARAQAPLIHAQAVATKVMPPGNLTGMTDEERAGLGAWISAGAP